MEGYESEEICIIIFLVIFFVFCCVLFFITLFTKKEKIGKKRSVIVDSDEVVVGRIPHVSVFSGYMVFNLYFTERHLIFAFLIFYKRYNKHTFDGFEEEVERLTDDVSALLADSDYNFAISYSDIDRVVVTKRGFKVFYNEYIDGVLKRRVASVVLTRMRFNEGRRNIGDYADLLYRYFGSVIEDKKNFLNRF